MAGSSGDGVGGVGGDILLDAGTNELEVLIFELEGGSFGVNVAKVREVIKPVRLHASPHRHPAVLGMFNMRGHVLPVVDLAGHLGMRAMLGPEAIGGQIIITEFNGLRTGFVVGGVDRIHRLSWKRVEPTPDLNVCVVPSGRRGDGDGDGGSGGEGGGLEGVSARVVSSTTGMIQLDDRLVLMLDFESVADEILFEQRLHIDSVENELGVDRGSKRVLMAEDSPFMRRLMSGVLRASGYERLEVYSDGQALWDAIGGILSEGGDGASGGCGIDAVVSDIEMPQLDGLALTRKIKGDPRLAGVPVLLFSSLISDDNRKKGEQVGADAQMPKPELAEVVRMVDRLCSGESVGDEPMTIRVA